MHKIWIIAWREYRTRVTSLLFISVTALTFLVLVGGPIIAALVSKSLTAKPVPVSVIDETGRLLAPLTAALARSGPEPAPGSAPESALPAPGAAGLANNARAAVAGRLELQAADPAAAAGLLVRARNGDLPAVLVISGSGPDTYRAAISSSSLSTLDRAKAILKPAWQSVIQAERLQKLSVDPAVLQALRDEPPLAFVQLTTGESDATALGIRTAIAGVFNMLMYMGILMYAALTFQGVLEEKSSRVMEVLVAAVKPEQLLAGKVLGLGMVGLTQFATWFLAYLVLLAVPAAMLSTTLARVSPTIFLYMLAYFILGFFAYAALYAAAASTISRMEDSQALIGPLSMLVVPGYMLSILALQNPNGSVVRWVSLVPWFAPSVMVTRMALSQPPFWEVAVSLLLLALTVVGTVWLAARVYRVGVLLYGSRPTLKAMWRYVREG